MVSLPIKRSSWTEIPSSINVPSGNCRAPRVSYRKDLYLVERSYLGLTRLGIKFSLNGSGSVVGVVP